MATVIDLLRHLGQHAAPNGENALAGPVMLAGVSDATLSLPLAPDLVRAWSTTVGRNTLGHHALALSAAQAGHSVALMGHGPAPHADLLLLSLSQLRFEQTTLWIIPDEVRPLRATLIKLADQLNIRWVDAANPGGRVTQAHLVLVSPQDLHRRVLRFHDRAWRWLWSRLRIVAIPELQRFNAATAGHLRWLLRRIARLTTNNLQVLSSVAPIADAEITLNRLLERSVHVIAAPAGPTHNTLIALWHTGRDRKATIIRLAQQLAERRLGVAALGRTVEESVQLRAAMSAANLAPSGDEPRVALVAGIPPTIEERHSLLRASYRLLLLLVGDQPHERLLAAQPDLLLQTLPRWPLATNNPYIASAHLACAAAERPVSEPEIDQWQMRELRDRLLRKGSLIALPSGDLWQSAPTPEEPYSTLNPMTVSGEPVIVYDPTGNPLATLSPALLDRRALPGLVYDAGLRVAKREDDAQRVQLEHDPVERSTAVQADVEVTIREEIAARSVRCGKVVANLTRGKVAARQRVWGIHEYLATGEQRQRRLATPVESQWTAAACWIGLGAEPEDSASLGWTIQQALPFVILAQPSALCVTYDPDPQRLYVIETEPGGVGLVDCVYAEFERLIELAYAMALATRTSPVFGAIAAAEQAWLNVLRGEKPAERPKAGASETRDQRATPALSATGSSQQAGAADKPSEQVRNLPRIPANGRPRVYLQRQADLSASDDVVRQPAGVAANAAAAEAKGGGTETSASSSVPALPRAIDRPLTPAGPVAKPDPTPVVSAYAQPAAARDEPQSVPTAGNNTAPPVASDNRVQIRPGNELDSAHEGEAAQPDTRASQGTSPEQEAYVLDHDAQDNQHSGADQPAAAPEPGKPFVPAARDQARPATTPPVAEPAVRRTIVYEAAEEQEPPMAAVGEQGHHQSEAAEVMAAVAPSPGTTELPQRMEDEAPPQSPIGHAYADADERETEVAEVAPVVKEAGSQRDQYLIDDLLPPLEDEMTDPRDDIADEPDLEPASLPQITRFRPQVRPSQREDRGPVEPRPPLPFRRPDQPSQERQRPAANERSGSQYGRPASRPGSATQQRSDRPVPPAQAPKGRRGGSADPSDVTPGSPNRGIPGRFDEVRRPASAGTPTDRPNQQPPNREPFRASPQQHADEAMSSAKQRPVGKETRPAGSPKPPPGRSAANPPHERQSASAEEPAANVTDMIARMRRLREQREAEQSHRRSPSVPRPERPSATVELRFHIGERVQCLPYGIGVVQASKVSDGRELVVIDFPEYGQIEVDPAVSLVRQLGQNQPTGEDWHDEGS